MLTVGNDKYEFDSNGNITGVNRSDWNKFWHGSGMTEEQQRYMAEYNRANQQYADQFGLQQNAFQFNKDLSERQQALAEDSYYNGTLRQADQLQQLGINPASFGGSISGMSMSSGSSVSAGSTSASSNPSSRLEQKADILGLLTNLATVANQSKQVDIAQQNADTNQYNAETSRISAENSGRKINSDIEVNNSSIASSVIKDNYIKSQIDNINSDTDYRKLIYEDKKSLYDSLHSNGMYASTFELVQNMDWQTGVAIGVASLLFNITSPSKTSTKPDGTSYTKQEKKELVDSLAQEVVQNAMSYEALAPAQRDAVDRFYSEHPNIPQTGKDFPSSNLLEWKRSGYSDDQIYKFLCRYYGVK